MPPGAHDQVTVTTGTAAQTDIESAAPVTLGPGPETLALQISEDAYQGDAHFTVAINGVQIGGVQTATASHQAGDSQTVDINGSFGSVNTATLTFLNDAYAGTAATDRNLYLTGANLNGAPIASGVLTELSQGAQSFSFNDPAATATATSPVTLHLAEDSSAGDAQFSVSVDGQAASSPQTVTASDPAGATQAFNLAAMAPGLHDVAVSFLNAAPGRDLYVTGIDVRNIPAPGASAMLTTNSTLHFAITVPSS